MVVAVGAPCRSGLSIVRILTMLLWFDSTVERHDGFEAKRRVRRLIVAGFGIALSLRGVRYFGIHPLASVH